MKMKRLVASILALLLMVSLLPIGAMAEGEKHITTDTAEISDTQSNVIIDNGVTVNINNGSVKENNGTVGLEDSNSDPVADTGNNGTIETNNGVVVSNNENGTVEINGEDGTVETNNGDIVENYGTVETNDGDVWWNYGAVETNTIDGVVYNEFSEDGDGNDIIGTVTNNYGTQYTALTKDVPQSSDDPNYKIEYGVQVKNTDGNEDTSELRQASSEEYFILHLADMFTRVGYKLVGYTDITPKSEKPDEDWDGPVGYASNNDPTALAAESSKTDFTATHPSILSLIWEAIVDSTNPGGNGSNTNPGGNGSSSDDAPEAKTTKKASVLTSLSADKVKVGTYVRCGSMTFIIIEVTDTDIRVATVGTLSEQDLADMLGCLKKHLSDAQIAKLIGEPELLEQELVDKFFGGSGEHIAFRASRDLFA